MTEKNLLPLNFGLFFLVWNVFTQNSDLKTKKTQFYETAFTFLYNIFIVKQSLHLKRSRPYIMVISEVTTILCPKGSVEGTKFIIVNFPMN